MSVIGIVSEYNPFHMGHLYQLEKSREMLGGESTVICAMSGDFVQRGEPAMYSKYARAEAACRCGADLVVELPVQWSLASAESFARGGVSLLSSLGAEYLSFGSECGDVNALDDMARYLVSDDTNERIINIMKAAPELSYASAREKLAAAAGQNAELLRMPNNILAVEYLKAIKQLGLNMHSLTVTRVGSGHDEKGSGNIRSASELREHICNGINIDEYVPREAMEIFRGEREQGRELSDRCAFETAVLSRLRMLKEEEFFALPDAEEGLCRRIYKAVQTKSSLEEIFDTAKTKRYAHSRIRRLCISAAIGLKADKIPQLPPYARILAANARGRSYLRSISKDTAIPLITKTADIRQYQQQIIDVFADGASAHDLFVLFYGRKCPTNCGEDWRKGPVIV